MKFAICILSLLLASASFAQTNILFIFDASGSMKTKVKGETRIAAAKKAMAAALRGMPADVRLGLMMYGHRRAKDCTDIELVAPIGSEDAQTINAIVQKVVPKGETPIADALVKAAKSFAAFKGQQNTIVLVTDGMEECHGDPCAAARALKDAGLGLKVHIVGYMLDAKSRYSVECISTETGGRYFDASDPRSLTAALQEVRKVVIEAPRVAPASVPAPPPTPVVSATPVAPPPAPEIIGLKVTGYYAAKGRPVKQNITYTVLEEKADLAGNRKKVAQSYDGPPSTIFKDLVPGKYVLQASIGQVTREFPVEVPVGKAVDFQAVLDIADVRLDATLKEGGPQLPANLVWQVLETKAKLDGSRTRVEQFYDVAPGGVYIVPAGEWLLSGVVNSASYLKVEKPLKVVAGDEMAVSYAFDAARVRLDAKLAAAGPAHSGNVTWAVFSPKKALDGSRAKLTYFYDVGNGYIALFPAGEWVLVGTLRESSACTVEKPIKIVAAEEQAIDVDFEAGLVEMAATAKGAPFTGEVTWSAFQPAPTPTEPKAEKRCMSLYHTSASTHYLLPAGTYRIEAEAGGSNAKAQASVTVKAGGAVAVKAELK